MLGIRKEDKWMISSSDEMQKTSSFGASDDVNIDDGIEDDDGEDNEDENDDDVTIQALNSLRKAAMSMAESQGKKYGSLYGRRFGKEAGAASARKYAIQMGVDPNTAEVFGEIEGAKLGQKMGQVAGGIKAKGAILESSAQNWQEIDFKLEMPNKNDIQTAVNLGKRLGEKIGKEIGISAGKVAGHQAGKTIGHRIVLDMIKDNKKVSGVERVGSISSRAKASKDTTTSNTENTIDDLIQKIKAIDPATENATEEITRVLNDASSLETLNSQQRSFLMALIRIWKITKTPKDIQHMVNSVKDLEKYFKGESMVITAPTGASPPWNLLKQTTVKPKTSSVFMDRMKMWKKINILTGLILLLATGIIEFRDKRARDKKQKADERRHEHNWEVRRKSEVAEAKEQKLQRDKEKLTNKINVEVQREIASLIQDRNANLDRELWEISIDEDTYSNDMYRKLFNEIKGDFYIKMDENYNLQVTPDLILPNISKKQRILWLLKRTDDCYEFENHQLLHLIMTPDEIVELKGSKSVSDFREKALFILHGKGCLGKLLEEKYIDGANSITDKKQTILSHITCKLLQRKIDLTYDLTNDPFYKDLLLQAQMLIRIGADFFPGFELVWNEDPNQIPEHYLRYILTQAWIKVSKLKYSNSQDTEETIDVDDDDAYGDGKSQELQGIKNNKFLKNIRRTPSQWLHPNLRLYMFFKRHQIQVNALSTISTIQEYIMNRITKDAKWIFQQDWFETKLGGFEKITLIYEFLVEIPQKAIFNDITGRYIMLDQKIEDHKHPYKYGTIDYDTIKQCMFEATRDESVIYLLTPALIAWFSSFEGNYIDLEIILSNLSKYDIGKEFLAEAIDVPRMHTDNLTMLQFMANLEEFFGIYSYSNKSGDEQKWTPKTPSDKKLPEYAIGPLSYQLYREKIYESTGIEVLSFTLLKNGANIVKVLEQVYSNEPKKANKLKPQFKLWDQRHRLAKQSETGFPDTSSEFSILRNNFERVYLGDGGKYPAISTTPQKMDENMKELLHFMSELNASRNKLPPNWIKTIFKVLSNYYWGGEQIKHRYLSKFIQMLLYFNNGVQAIDNTKRNEIKDTIREYKKNMVQFPLFILLSTKNYMNRETLTFYGQVALINLFITFQEELNEHPYDLNYHLQNL